MFSKSGSHIIYVNATCQDDTPLGKLMQDFYASDPAKMHYSELAERTDYFKNHSKGVNTMCKIMEEFGLRQQAKGRLESAQNIALRMLAKGKYSIEEIAEVTKLSLEEIRALANEKIA